MVAVRGISRKSFPACEQRFRQLDERSSGQRDSKNAFFSKKSVLTIPLPAGAFVELAETLFTCRKRFPGDPAHRHHRARTAFAPISSAQPSGLASGAVARRGERDER